MSKVDELKQRLQKVAYKGMVNRRGPQSFDEAHKGSISDTMADTIQEGFYEEETRKKILDRIDATELPHKQEVTCGASSEHCLEDWENIIEDGQVGNVPKIKGVGGFYSGPGAEHSLNRLNLKSKEKEVGHTWLELPDKTIIDASAGQFIDPKHEPLKQRQRFRIIPKESGLHKYYKKDPLLTHRIERDFNDPDHHRARKLRKQGIDPFPSRKAKLKQRLAAIREAPKIRKHQFKGSPFVKSNDELTPMKTTHFLELAADAGKNLPNTGTITGLADAHSNPKYDEPYFKGLERGDELGVVEQKKKDIRHKGKTGVPLLINKDNQNQITGHEGRHLGRALLEEGFDEIPVEFAEGFMNTQPVKKYKNIKNLKRQDRNEMPNIKKDTRAPIFGRYSKLKQRLASIPGLWEDQSISHISVPSETPKPMWNRKQIKRHYDASGPLKTKFITDAGKREAIGADKTIDDYFDKNPQGEKLTKQYKKLEGIGNKGLRKIPARRVVHNPFEGPSYGFDELSGLTDEDLPYRTRPSERFAPEPKEGSTEELESLIGIEPKLSFDESLKRYPRPKNVMYRSVAEKHAKLKQRLSRLEE